MTFLSMMFSPRLYKEYTNESQSLAGVYEPNGLERWGDKILSTLSWMWNIGYYTSPIIVICLYRRGYLASGDSITSLYRISTGIGLLVVISLCMRSLGRSQNSVYVKFLKALDANKARDSSAIAKESLRKFDFDFESWPVDFSVKDLSGDERKPPAVSSSRNKPLWMSSLPCEIAAYLAIHSFGIRMIYPGSLSLLQYYLQPMLVQGRAKLIADHNARRYKVRTEDNNDIDTIFVDKRNGGPNGRTLVICSEGNAGFYEVGIMSTPLSLNYSVLGWNHPGFGGSTGRPYPEQDKLAIDAVMQFAIHELGFVPEQILLFGWSIGGYSSIYAATLYPDVKGVLLDATFDDVLQLALPRMWDSISGIVRIAIRQYVNLHNAELMNSYAGPVLLVRRTEDEIIAEEFDLSSNRGNHLVLSILKYRYPNIYTSEQIQNVTQILSKPLDESNIDYDNDVLSQSLLVSYAEQYGPSFPCNIGTALTDEQREIMAIFLLRKHLIDFKSSHCSPLPGSLFQMPWRPRDEDANEYVMVNPK